MTVGCGARLTGGEVGAGVGTNAFAVVTVVTVVTVVVVVVTVVVVVVTVVVVIVVTVVTVVANGLVVCVVVVADGLVVVVVVMVVAVVVLVVVVLVVLVVVMVVEVVEVIVVDVMVVEVMVVDVMVVGASVGGAIVVVMVVVVTTAQIPLLQTTAFVRSNSAGHGSPPFAPFCCTGFTHVSSPGPQALLHCFVISHSPSTQFCGHSTPVAQSTCWADGHPAGAASVPKSLICFCLPVPHVLEHGPESFQAY